MGLLFVIILAVLLLGVGVVALIESEPGYVLISYGTLTIETSLWVALVLLVVLVLVLYFVLRFIVKVMTSRGSMAHWMSSRRLNRGRHLTSLGLASYLEGDWTRARRRLLQGAPDVDTPALNYLIAARASFSLHEEDKAQEYLLVAETGDAAMPQAAALTRARLQLGAGRFQQAVDTLENISGKAAKTAYFQGLLMDAYQSIEEWDKLSQLIPQLKKSKVISAEEAGELSLKIHGQLLEQSGGSGVDAVNQAWAACPDELRSADAALVRYAELLLAEGAHADVEKLLVKTLKKNWSPQLLALYSQVEGKQPAKQLRLAESWLKAHPDDADLQRCLGRLCLRNQQWEKAREYFEASQRGQPSSETCAELARLLFALGEREKSAQCYREGLLLEQQNLPDLPLPLPALSAPD